MVRICLFLPSIVMYRIFLRKIKYLAKLLLGDSESISSRVFVSTTIADPVNVSLIQQCRMLESIIGVSLVNECLRLPEDTLHLISTSKVDILHHNLMLKGSADYLSPSISCPSNLSLAVKSGIECLITGLEAQKYCKKLFFI